MDAQWSDDFHHSLFTLLWSDPGRGYYDDFGSMGDLAKSLKRVFVYDGVYSSYLRPPPREAGGGGFLPITSSATSRTMTRWGTALGERLEHLVGMDAAKVALGIVLTAPFVPMLFMGEEFAASSPFLYFADHEDEEMRRLVAEGRKRTSQPSVGMSRSIPDPESVETFDRSKLNWSEVHEGRHQNMLQWTKELIHLRRTRVALNDGDLGHRRWRAARRRGSW